MCVYQLFKVLFSYIKKNSQSQMRLGMLSVGKANHASISQPLFMDRLFQVPTSFPSCILASGLCSVAQAANDFLCVPCWCSIYIKASL